MNALSILTEIRAQRPLLHCISNAVSSNDCANLALAIGASPVMAPAFEEAEAMTMLAQATVLNLGTPDAARFRTCKACLSAVEKHPQPVIMDPVGVGASRWRLHQTAELLAAFHPTILRLNFGEALALCGLPGQEQGVDSVGAASEHDRANLAVRLAQLQRTTVLLTGKEDYVTDGRRVFRISGGSERICRITGAGDMLSVLCAAFTAVEQDAAMAAAQAAVFWKCCAEYAETVAADQGIGSFHFALLDAAESVRPEQLQKEGRMIQLH